MNKSSVRRALTTLKKNNLLTHQTIDENKIYFQICVDEELVQPKKKVYIKKVKKAAPKKQFTIVGDVFTTGALIINNKYKK